MKLSNLKNNSNNLSNSIVNPTNKKAKNVSDSISSNDSIFGSKRSRSFTDNTSESSSEEIDNSVDSEGSEIDSEGSEIDSEKFGNLKGVKMKQHTIMNLKIGDKVDSALMKYCLKTLLLHSERKSSKFNYIFTDIHANKVCIDV
jgi:hypothetical protein